MNKKLNQTKAYPESVATHDLAYLMMVGTTQRLNAAAKQSDKRRGLVDVNDKEDGDAR